MFCTKVKEFLSRKQVSFLDRDITTDAEALKDLERLGYMTTPVTVVGGEVVVGFDRQKLEKALDQA